MTPNSPAAQNSPLSLQGEGWGEGALEPNTYVTGNYCSRASSLLRKAAPTQLPPERTTLRAERRVFR